MDKKTEQANSIKFVLKKSAQNKKKTVHNDLK